MEIQRGPRGCPPPLSRRTAVDSAARRGPPSLTWGAPAPNPVPRSGSSFPPCPGDFSAPESRSLGQVPPAASSPRGTPEATPLLASHWLAFTPVIFQLAEGSPAMQIRTEPPARRLAGATGAAPRGFGSDWSRGPANDADAGRVPGPGARRAACRGSSRGGGRPGDPRPVLSQLRLRLRRAPAGRRGSGRVLGASPRQREPRRPGSGRGGPVS